MYMQFQCLVMLYQFLMYPQLCLLNLLICLFFHQTPVTDIVDPPDFEEIVNQQKLCEKDSCHPFVDFPEEDISVYLLKREQRTVDAVPADVRYGSILQLPTPKQTFSASLVYDTSSIAQDEAWKKKQTYPCGSLTELHRNFFHLYPDQAYYIRCYFCFSIAVYHCTIIFCTLITNHVLRLSNYFLSRVFRVVFAWKYFIHRSVVTL